MTSLAGLLPDLTPLLPGIVFFVMAALAIGGAALAALAPRIVHAAFGLMGAFFGVAGLYALLGQDFLAFTQIIVYVGGILILLVFGVLLTGRAKGQLGLEVHARRWPAIVVGGLLFAGLLAAFSSASTDFHAGGTLSTLPEPKGTTVGAIGRSLLAPSEYLFPFELVSVFLLVALVGAAYLVRRRRTSS